MIEIDTNSFAKAKKRVWIKPTAKKVGHYRMQEVGVKEEEKVEPKKPFATWITGMPHPAGFKEGAIVDMGDGKKHKILEGYIIAPDFKCDDGNWYKIQDITKIHSGGATNVMPDLSEYREKKAKESAIARVKEPKEKDGKPKEKFEIDSNKFFEECYETERDSNNLRSLQEYSGKNYNEVNEYLITGKSQEDKDKLDSQIRNISEILSKAPKYEGKVFRGMRFGSKDKFDEFLLQCDKSEQLSIKNFASTSINKSVASKFASGFDYGILFTIKSKRGIFLGDVSANVDEKEVLFNHESEFKISDVKKISDNKFEIAMEEV